MSYIILFRTSMMAGADLYMDPMKIPDLVKERVFTMLPTGSLCNSRLVAHNWNDYLKQLLKKEKIQRHNRDKLSRSWRMPQNEAGDPMYTFNETLIELPFPCDIEAVSNEKILLKTWSSVPLAESRIAVYDVTTNVLWEILNINRDLEARALYNDFRCCITQKFLAIRIGLTGPVNLNLVRVFSLARKVLIYEETVRDMVYMCVNKFETPNHLVIFSKEISVLNFRDDGILTRSSFEVSNNDYSYGSYNSPFILQCLYNDFNSVRSINVWRYDEDSLSINLHVAVPNLDTFVKLDESEGFINNVEDVVFTNNYFIMTTKLSARDMNDLELSYYFCTAIHITDMEGNILKEKLMFESEPDAYKDYIFFNNKLFYEYLEDVYICETPLQHLFENIHKGRKDDLKFNVINDMRGRSHMMLTQTEARHSTIEVHPLGPVLRLGRLDFYGNVF